MHHTIVRIALVAMLAVVNAGSSAAQGLVGTWELVSRTDRDASGRVISEMSLGATPIGYLIYDAAGHVSAQLASRERSGMARPRMFTAASERDSNHCASTATCRADSQATTRLTATSWAKR